MEDINGYYQPNHKNNALCVDVKRLDDFVE